MAPSSSGDKSSCVAPAASFRLAPAANAVLFGVAGAACSGSACAGAGAACGMEGAGAGAAGSVGAAGAAFA